MTSTTEWTGVALATLFREVGASPDAAWFLAEGQDAAVMTRSVPMEKAWDDALIAYAQNGEALRPGQGYPAGCCCRAGKATPTSSGSAASSLPTVRS